MDARKTAKKTVTTTDKAGMARWRKNPGKSDVSGVDTKGKGKAKKKKGK